MSLLIFSLSQFPHFMNINRVSDIGRDKEYNINQAWSLSTRSLLSNGRVRWEKDQVLCTDQLCDGYVLCPHLTSSVNQTKWDFPFMFLGLLRGLFPHPGMKWSFKISWTPLAYFWSFYLVINYFNQVLSLHTFFSCIIISNLSIPMSCFQISLLLILTPFLDQL